MIVWHWLLGNYVLLTWLGSASLVLLVASVVLLPVALVKIPADYFMHARPEPVVLKPRSHLTHVTLKVLRNGAGLIFLVCGLIMFVLPGPGLVTVVIGVVLLQFPGKFRLEAWLVRRRLVHGPINWIRHRRGHAPLQIPPARR